MPDIKVTPLGKHLNGNYKFSSYALYMVFICDNFLIVKVLPLHLFEDLGLRYVTVFEK